MIASGPSGPLVQLSLDGSYWVEPVLSKDQCVLLSLHCLVLFEPRKT